MKIVTVVGARPQFIKAAAVSREIARHAAIEEIVVHTGQHFDRNMSAIFFEEMAIPEPDYFLDINSLQHGAMTGRMLEKIEEILESERPDKVVVYGDTNSTLAGALAARKLNIDVVHVEAGLRSFNMDMPEEVNRIVTDRISAVLCCPTQNAVDNLRREGFDDFDCTVVNTGDVMHDAALYYARMSAERSTVIERLSLRGAPFALCTLHRAENTDDPARLRAIADALNVLSRECQLIVPLHPRTKKMLAEHGIALRCTIIDPVGYFDMLELLKNCRIVLTDSGGLQKEAFFFARPCVTLRDETEWTELCDAGANLLAGADTDRIVSAFREMSIRPVNFSAALYGSGDASRRIIEAMQQSRQTRKASLAV
jgi:UDP-GlcNAc3NAcA epimerase